MEQNTSVNGLQTVTGRKFYYWGTSTLIAGQALCMSFDYPVGTDTADQNQKNRATFVEKPDIRHQDEHFAGFVAPGQVKLTGPAWIELIPNDPNIVRPFQVYTDQSVTDQQLMGLQPGSFNVGRYCGFGRPLGRFTQTVDRSTTAGSCYATVGGIIGPDATQKYLSMFRAEFTGDAPLGTTANLGTLFSTVGTNSTATLAAMAGGVLALASITSGFVSNVNMVGESFALTSGNPLFFLTRIAVNSIASTTSAFVGLSITDAGYWASKGSDYIGFEIVTGALSFVYRKASGTAVSSTFTPAITLVADTYVDLAFYFDGKSTLYVWVNGTLQTITNTSAQRPTRTLTFIAEAAVAAVVLSIDRVSISNVK